MKILNRDYGKKDIKSVKYGNIEVFYYPRLDGGGASFGQDFVPVVHKKFGKVGRVFEFCAGPGFIGFSLLANGLCDSLCLADVNSEAVEMCNLTVKKNRLNNKVSVYCSDVFDRIPNSEKWDLVVGNPPHFFGTLKDYKRDPWSFDPSWSIHKRFYAHVADFLNPNASVLLQENCTGSNEMNFLKMIENGGLEYVESFRQQRPLHVDFIESVRPALNKNTSLAILFSKIPKVPRLVYQRIRERINPAAYPYYFIHSKNTMRS